LATGGTAIGLLDGLYNALSRAYLKHRPRYPSGLFQYLANRCPERAVAWDCATGNGQAAVGLAEHFSFVWATDAARKQIKRAKRHPKVAYAQADCEESELPPMSVDLVCVAQALHWFGDFGSFYREVARVLRPSGVFAAVCYFLPRAEGSIDEKVSALYSNESLRRYWYPGLRHVEDGYQYLPLPFDTQNERVNFTMAEDWTLAQFQGYLRTWSHVARASRDGESATIRRALDEIKKAWGNSRERRVTWDVVVRVAVKC
jgi:ubiquinone/menaquinone biosynthesis C-methylase UbiE